MTTAVSIKEFRARTDEILDTVIEGEETVIVTLADGRKFVLVPGAEWQSMDESAYLTSTAANRAALAKSLKEAADPLPLPALVNRNH
jgi:prevent-host-death family protein